MTFKEFKTICKQYLHDELWDDMIAAQCAYTISTINKNWFWKREKCWQHSLQKNAFLRYICQVLDKSDSIIILSKQDYTVQ